MEDAADTADAGRVAKAAVVAMTARTLREAIHAILGRVASKFFEAGTVGAVVILALVRASCATVGNRGCWRVAATVLTGDAAPAGAVENIAVVLVTWWRSARPSHVQTPETHIATSTAVAVAATSQAWVP